MFYFCKMQALGNDFVIVNYIEEKFEYSFKLLAEFLCDRHYGVGADGLIVIDKSEIADLKMRIFNPDGSEAEMCGNGIQCFSKYVYEHGIIKKEKFEIETKAGVRGTQLVVEGKTVLKAKVEMGKPIFDYDKIPVIYEIDEEILEDKVNIQNTCEKDIEKNVEKDYIENTYKYINIDGKEFYPISFGNPHAVCFVENLEEIDINKIGKKVENYKCFPNKTNVEFVQIINENKIKVRVWERGVGETFSCGTGSCAAVIISHVKKSTNCEVIVDLMGGILNIKYDKENEKVYLEGEAKEVFEGNIKI